MLTDKQVEDGFSYEPEYEYANPVDTGYVQRNRRAFREWKAGVERAAAARALEEAADAALEVLNDGSLIELSAKYGGYYRGVREGGKREVERLRARAAEIREGK